MSRPASPMATVLGIAVAVLVSVLVPGTYVISSFTRSHAELRTAVGITAGMVMNLISSAPETWRYQQPRLENLIERGPIYTQLPARWQILDDRGNVLATVGNRPGAPGMTVSTPLYDAGLMVGEVRGSLSLRGFAQMAAVFALLGIALGLSVYFTVRRLTNASRQNEQALREREARYRAIVETSMDGFWILDKAGRVLEVNERYLQRSGYSRDELLRMTLHDIDASPTPARVTTDLAKTGTRILEAVHRAKDGSVWPLEVSTVYVPQESGRRYSFLRDITERKRAEQALKSSAETLAAVMTQLTLAEEQERRAIAMDLHDHLCQLLAAANIRLRSLPAGEPGEALRQAIAVVEQAERAARSLSFQISPPLLFDLGLVPALEWLATELHKVYGLTVRVHDDGKPKNVAASTRSVLYRATRELLINVAKHARVNDADVDIRADEGLLVISVSDSGVGFDKRVMEQPVPAAGFGLMSMRERLRLIGGSFEVDTRIGDGTVATLVVPLNAPSPVRANEATAAA